MPEPTQYGGSLIGRMIGPHKVISLLGAGGMGEVYLSHDTRLDRTVALKILPADIAADEDRMRRFIREAKAASALNHANVATVYDIGQSGGLYFIAMEYVQGQTLAQKIRAGAVDTTEIIEIGRQAADALDAAHDKGITHRDIKPANLMLTPRGQVKVLDFGLAKIVRPQDARDSSAVTNATETLPGVVMGTLAYMSPEQVLGRDVDHRGDIFSLGIVLYEMATGRSPFLGSSTADTTDRILHAQPVAIERFNQDLPAELARIINKCLQKDRENRYQSARDLLVDLKNFQRDRGANTVEQNAAPGSSTKSRRILLAVGALALMLAAMGLVAYLRNRTALDQPIDAIAVLPFVNDSADPEAEYLSDGITESLINSLSRVPKLSVIARTTAFSYKGKTADLRKIGRDLNIRAIVTGRLTHRGDNLTIQADLIDVETGRQLWGDHYPRKLADILTVQDDIVMRILDGLRLRLSAEQQQQLAKHYTDNPDAYQQYLQGRYYAWKATRDDFEKGLARFDRAIQLDPRYALAYAGEAEAYMWTADVAVPAREAGTKAKELAITALGLDDNISEAHCALAFVLAAYDWDWPNADREFDRARKLDPGSGCVGDNYGIILVQIGRFDEGLQELKRALQLDPRSPFRHGNLGLGMYYANQYEAATKPLLEAKDLDPSFVFSRLWLGWLYEQQGKFDEAIAEFQALAPDFPDAAFSVAHALNAAGRRGEALRILQRLKGAKPLQSAGSQAWGLATIYTGLGDKDQAFEWLKKARDAHFVVFASIKVDPIFRSLRSDPRYADLIRSIGLEP